MTYPGIYAIVNAVNGKLYIGSSKDVPSQLVGHSNALCGGYHDNEHLQRAFNKYGAHAFAFAMLKKVDELSELLHWEQRFLDAAKPEYNMSPIAGKLFHTPEIRAKMSAALAGRIFSPEHRENLSKSKRVRIPREISSRNTSGYCGVSFDKKRCNWLAQVHLNGKTVFNKRYDSAFEAHTARERFLEDR